MKTQPQVTYDEQLRIDGVLTLIQAGVLHYFRLPHPALWSPVLQRMRAGGSNAVEVPFPWAYHSPAGGLYDFTGPRDIARLLDEIEAAGLWLIADVGPWIDADLNAGGLPAWFVHTPGVRPECASVVPPGPSFAFLRYVREWWERLLPFLIERPNLLLLNIDPGPCVEGQGLPRYLHALIEMARELGALGLFAAPAHHFTTDGEAPAIAGATILPLYRQDRDTLLGETQWNGEPARLPRTGYCAIVHPRQRKPRTVAPAALEHPRILISRILGQGCVAVRAHARVYRDQLGVLGHNGCLYCPRRWCTDGGRRSARAGIFPRAAIGTYGRDPWQRADRCATSIHSLRHNKPNTACHTCSRHHSRSFSRHGQRERGRDAPFASPRRRDARNAPHCPAG